MFWKKKDTQLFFVRGFQRSGTNWVCNLLNLHPDISCTGEFHLSPLHKATENIISRQHGLLKSKPGTYKELYYDFIKKTIIGYNKNSAWVGDRTPEALLNFIMPKSSYFVIHRDGREVLVSWMYHLLRIDHNFGPHLNKKKLLFAQNSSYFEHHKHELLGPNWVKNMAKYWNNRVVSDCNFISTSLPKEKDIKIMPLVYEDLLVNTDLRRNEMYKFLDLKPANSLNLNKLTSPGFDQHEPRSHYRIGKSGRWEEYFDKKLLNIFMQEAEQGLEKLEWLKSL